MNQLTTSLSEEYYQIKVQNAYVTSAYKTLDSIEFTTNLKRIGNIKKEEMEFVLQAFPEAETRKYNVTIEREW